MLNSKKQRGVMLLEALIAILIFSIGILAVVGMQAMSIQNVAQAKYRTDASFLANELIGLMWSADRSSGTFKGSFDYPGGSSDALLAWVNKVKDPKTGLPGATDVEPQVVVTQNSFPGVGGSGSYDAYRVTITIRWQTPQDKSDGDTKHNYTTVAYLQWCGVASTPKNNC